MYMVATLSGLTRTCTYMPMEAGCVIDNNYRIGDRECGGEKRRHENVVRTVLMYKIITQKLFSPTSPMQSLCRDHGRKQEAE